MKKKLAVVAVAVAALGLTGCADGVGGVVQGAPVQAPVEPVEQPVEAPAEPTQDEYEQEAFELLAELDPYFIGVPKNVVDEAAIAGCELFDAGGTFEDYVTIAVSQGVPAESAGFIAGYSFAVFCPEHEDVAG